jgi:porin
MRNIFIIVVAFIVLVTTNNNIYAQKKYSLGLSYTSEMQSDFGKKINWVNLLCLEGNYELWRNGELSLQTISIWKTRKQRILDDLQTFSNIEEDNMAINIFMMGYTHRFKNISLFGGIRNMNHDYFTSDYTSVFTNSSCGIYPTISSNFPVANYPLSALCLHGEFKLSESIVLKNSLYNGNARKLFSNEGSLFSLHPSNDGILNITELSYLSKSNSHGFYNIGSVLYSGNSLYYGNDNEEGEAKIQEKRTVNCATWWSLEKSIYTNGDKGVGFLLQGSLALTRPDDCKHYYGIGVVLNSIIPTRRKNIFGIFHNKAVFHEKSENTIEMTWKCNLTDKVILQPTFHYIETGSKSRVVGLVRLCYEM